MMKNKLVLFRNICVVIILCTLFVGSVYMFLSKTSFKDEVEVVYVDSMEKPDLTKVEGIVIVKQKNKNVATPPETSTPEIVSDDTVEVANTNISVFPNEQNLTDTGIDLEITKPVGNGFTDIKLASALPDKIIDQFVWHINKEYANHPIPELRRYAELSRRAFRGEPFSLNEMYDYVKAVYIINPNEANLAELEKYEKRLFGRTPE